MNFKLWLEIAELRKPTSKVKRQTIIKDKGTNVARPMTQFQWNTQLGNNIKLQMEPQGDNSYSVIFYVNDVLYDFASKKEGHPRDVEVLSNVFFVLKQKADKLGAQKLTFRAHKGERDERYITGLDPGKYKLQALAEIDKLKQEVLSKEPEWAPPTPKIVSLYQKIKREVPKAVQHDIIILLNRIIEKINKGEEIDDLIYALENKRPGPVIQTLKQWNDAVKSNSPTGLTVHKNRRREIYRRILQRDFTNWNISIDGDRFELTRSNP
jgi:hypothetical protein